MAEAMAVPIHRQENAPVRFEAVPAGRRHGQAILANGPYDRLVRPAKEGDQLGRKRSRGHARLLPGGGQLCQLTATARRSRCDARSGVGAELRMSDSPFQCATLAVQAWRAWCSHTW